MQNSLISIVQDYFERALQDVTGIKCLIMDQETTNIITLISSQSEILKKDVYLIEQIEKENQEKLQHMKSIYILRPTQKNFNLLQKEIKNPRFQEYNIFFTNTIQESQIEKIAEYDDKDLIKLIQEIFLDYEAINNDLFSFDIPCSIGLYKHNSQWTQSEYQILQRMTDGLFAIIMSLRRIPNIRYLGKSDACKKLAFELNSRINKDIDINSNQFDKDNKLLILILDRKEDPITPLLSQWTYQAMLHELIGTEKNMLNLSKVNKAYEREKIENKQFVISQEDQFFAQNMFCNFGELATNVKDAIDKMTSNRKSQVKIENLEDMQRALDALPELKQQASQVQKHLTLTCEISKIVEERVLMEVSRVEQELICKENKSESFKMVWEILNNKSIHIYEKLRIVLLYSIRYENDDRIKMMKQHLIKIGSSQQSVNLIQNTLDYAGNNQRQCDLFSNKDLFSQARSIMKTAFKDVPNVYTQHQSYILQLLDKIEQQKLRENDYPSTTNNMIKPNEIVVFMIGGITYEEAKDISIRNKQNDKNKIYLGGTFIHNSKTFLAEISQFNKQDLEISMVLDNKQGNFYQMQ